MAAVYVLVLVLLLFLPVGVLAGVGGIGLSRYLAARRFVADAAHAEATVVRLPARPRVAPADNGTFVASREFKPVVRFETTQGQMVEARVEFGTPKPSLALSQAVLVLYDPQQPHRVRLAVADGRKRAVAVLVAGCVAALALFLALFAMALALNSLVSG